MSQRIVEPKPKQYVSDVGDGLRDTWSPLRSTRDTRPTFIMRDLDGPATIQNEEE